MYHTLKAARKRRRRKQLKTAIAAVLLCIGLACGYLWTEQAEGIPEVPWIFDFIPQPTPSILQKQEVYTAVLPAQTIYCPEISLPIGSEQVLQAGENGQLRCTAEVVYQNGQEIRRTVLRREVLQLPVDRIIALGQQEAAITEIKNGYIRLPDGQVLTYTHTAVFQASAYPQASGVYPLTVGAQMLRIGIAAVDPAVIPPGTRMFIAANDGSFVYGIARAADSGRAGKQMELYFPTAAECMEFGERSCTVYFLG